MNTRPNPGVLVSPRTIGEENRHDDAVAWIAADGTAVTIRPIRPSDLTLEQEFVNGLSQRTAYQRLLSARRLSPEEVRRFTEIDVEREFALIATIAAPDAQHERTRAEREIGVARYVKEQASDSAEFAIVLSDDWQRRGVGGRLLARLIDAAKQRGVRRLFGTTLSENTAMVALAQSLGFATAVERGDAAMTNLTLDL
jgi:RimJ/RimL family protein N-acetyltransferase